MAPRFRGFPPQAVSFYEALHADNSRAFWQAHKSEYDSFVKAPMLDLLAELADHGPFHVFRPYQDVRFAKGRPPYKEQIGAYGESEGGAGHYVQFSADGLMIGAGYYAMASDQLARFREAVADDARGGELATLVEDAGRTGLSAGAISELKTAPRGYPKDHPRVEILRRKGLIMHRSWPVAPWLHTAKVVTRVRDGWERARPVCEWLDAHVGPTTLAPEDAERF
jgi:uncharacterized protein (TIGR02453 family)